jgi:hypothetical protein
MKDAETDGRGNAQRSTEFSLAFGEFRRRVTQFPDDAFRPIVKSRAILCQRQAAGCAMDERCAHGALQFGESLADKRLRNLKPPRRLTDRTGFDNGDEGEHSIELQHCSGSPKSDSANDRLFRTNSKGHHPVAAYSPGIVGGD